MQEALANIILGIQELQSLGARHFLVANLPNIGRAYEGFSIQVGSGSIFTPDKRDSVTALSFDFNDRLAVALVAELVEPLYELDIEGLVEEILANSAAFGIFLFDAIRPKTAIHAVIAEQAALLVPEPCFRMGLLTSIAALVGLFRWRAWSRQEPPLLS